MTLYIVRHADAKSRGGWDRPDHLRPLTKKGHHQSDGVLKLLGDAPIRRILSSGAVRCMDTVTPLAKHLGVEVTPVPELAEGADGATATTLVRSLAEQPGDSALCTHGDIVPEVLRALARSGTRYETQLRWPKGSVWVLEVTGTTIASGAMLEPTTG
jgi:phosphohistidine phosphatase SixA